MSSCSSPCPRAVACNLPSLTRVEPLPVVIWAMSVATLIVASTPAPDNAPPVSKVTTSTTLKLLSAVSVNKASLLGTPSPKATNAALSPIVTNVVTWMLDTSLAPAALTKPPVVPMMFCVVLPVRAGFSISVLADIATLAATTEAELPRLAVTLDVISLSMLPPEPDRMPPARLTICALNVAIWLAATSKAPLKMTWLPVPIFAVVVLTFVVSATAPATAYSPPDPASVNAKLSSPPAASTDKATAFTETFEPR